jgi:hypothetical protein
MAIRALLREPLLHFAAIGALIFAADAAWGERPRADVGAVVVDDAWARGVEAGLRRSLGRTPSAEELAAALATAVDDELLFREARSLGLERGDPIVRRRLIQKARFVHEDRAALAPADESALATYAEAHAERYRLPPRLAITQVFAAAERHEDPEAAARELRAQLEAGADPIGLGDPFAHGQRLGLRTAGDLDGLFGAGFVAALDDAADGAWRIARSSYGWHVVRVDRREEASDPPLATIRGRVEIDLRDERREEAAAAAVAELREAAELRVEIADEELRRRVEERL